MPAKIRLTRQGRKARPYYHIVVADSRAPRDGRFIQRLGSYDPLTNPATIELDFNSALDWLQKGAQPTDTCRAILSQKGVMMKNHLMNGVKKGAFTTEIAEQRFEAWLKEKEGKIEKTKELASKDAEDVIRKKLEAETRIREARAEELAKKLAKEAKSEAKAEEVEEQAPETPEQASEEGAQA
jgi:small subunit ribosomal protein S16